MPPRINSRHFFVTAYNEPVRDLTLTLRNPYRFRAFSDNIQHVVAEGDTLFNIAGRYYAGHARAAGFWWAIADFQPDPIHDPTLILERGRVIFVPSLRTLEEEILSERRRPQGEA